MIVIVACVAITLVLGARFTARAFGDLDLGGEKGGENMLYVFRVFQGAECFKKVTYYNHTDALTAFSYYSESPFTHLVLEVFWDDGFTETWIKVAPFIRVPKGGDKNE